MGVVVSSSNSPMEPLFNVTHMEMPHAAPLLAGAEIVSIIANVRDAKTSEVNK